MGTYTGTDFGDAIKPNRVSAGVTADPAGSSPSEADDVINGLGRGDMLSGGGGADRINGGDGYDNITTWGSGSILHGDAGNDTVIFTVEAGGGVQGVQGELYGDAGNDLLALRMTGAYDETPAAIKGSVLLYGGAGNDTIYGYIPPDPDLRFDVSGSTVFFYGGAGNDELIASRQDPNYDGSYYAIDSTDMLYGGPGNDSYFVFETKDQVIEKAGEGYQPVDDVPFVIRRDRC